MTGRRACGHPEGCCLLLLLRVAQRLWDRALRVVAFARRQFSYFSDATAVCRGDDDNDGDSLCGQELYFSTLSACQSHVLPTLMQALNESWRLAVICLATTRASPAGENCACGGSLPQAHPAGEILHSASNPGQHDPEATLLG